MTHIHQEQLFQDSNSIFSVSNFAPLEKREASKKAIQIACNTQQKIDSLAYQIVEELTIITPLEIHPSKFCEQVETYYYQRKLPSVMEHELKKRQQRQKIDFVMAITSLFKKAFTKVQNKFTILLPTGGIIYFFMEEIQDWPKLIIASRNYDFSSLLDKDGIKYRQLNRKQYERERLIIEGQHIRLFFGYFLNWIISANISIQIFSNFSFEYAFRQNPMILKLVENRNEYEHLYYREDTCIGEKLSKLYLIKLQSVWYKQDIAKIQQKIRFYQEEFEKKHKTEKIQHDYQFKICKFSIDLNQNIIDMTQKSQIE